MFKKSILFCAISVLSSGALSNTLFEVYEKGMGYNAQILSAQKDYDSEKENINLSSAALKPKFGIEANLYRADVDINSSNYDTSYTGLNYAVKFQQPLYAPKSYEQHDLSKLGAKVAEAQYQETRDQKGFEIVQSYFDYLRYQNNVLISKKKEKALESQLKRVQKEYELGAANRLHLNEAESAYDVAKVETLTQRGRLEIAQENLAKQTGDYYTQLVSIDYRAKMFDVEKDFTEWKEQAIQQNPTINKILKAREAAEKEVDVAKSEYKPTINFFTSYEYLDSGDDRNLQGGDRNLQGGDRNLQGSDRNYLVFGVELNYPIYTGGSTTSKVKKAGHQYQKVNYTYLDATRNVSAEIKKVYRNFQLTIENINARKKAFASSKDALEATKKGYALGQRNFQDVINAERNYYDALLSYVNSKYDYISQYFYLEYLSGNLNESTVLSISQWMEKVKDTGALKNAE